MSDNLTEVMTKAKEGNKRAREQLVLENSGLIWSVAKRYFGKGVDPDDLFQLGCIGFLKAIDGFDTKYGTQFSTYAVPKIAGEIRRFLRDDGMVKVSRNIKERAIMIKAARHRMIIQMNREPTLSELSEEMGLTVQEIASAEMATAGTESIYKETGEDGFTLESILSDGSMEEHLLEEISLKEAIRRLEERERIVILLRYFKGLTQEKTAKIMNVSQVQISRIERKALGRLRTFLHGADDKPEKK